MNVLADSLNILGTILENFFLYRIVDLMYAKRLPFFRAHIYSRILTWSIIGVMTCVVLYLNQAVLTSPHTMSILFGINILLISLFWKCDIPGAMTVAGVFYLMLYLLGGTEIAITGLIGGDELIYATTMENGLTRVIYLIILTPILCGVNQVIYAWLRGQLKKGASLKYLLYISIMGIVGSTFIMILMLSEFNIVINAAWFILVMIVAVLIFAGYYFVKSRQLQESLDRLDDQNRMLERNYEQLRDFYSGKAGLYHDMNHHINVMHYLLQQGEAKRAKEYIESIREPMDGMTIESRTGIDVLDVVISEAEWRAKEKGILFLTEITILPQDIMVEKRDLCALFANLLDNALQSAQKEVKMQVKIVYRQLLIQVQNDCKLRPLKRGGRFVTTKSDKHLHGFGIQNIEYVVQKYHGSMDVKMQDGFFRVDIMINI